MYKGDFWHLPVSNKSGPIFLPRRNAGAQRTPTPEIKGLKLKEKGRLDNRKKKNRKSEAEKVR
jgi:hypothetical protein